MKHPEKIVAITGLHRGDNPQPGAAVIRSLRRQYPNIRIIGLSYDPLESGLYSRDIDLLHAAYSLPFPGNGSAVLRERLSVILESEKIDFIVPNLDSEILNFIELAPFFQEHGIEVVLPSKKALRMRSKPKLAAFCESNHIPVPTTYSGFDVESLSTAAEKIGYPLYVKGRYYEGRLIYNPEDLAKFANELLEMWGGPVLVQQAIVGEEYCCTGIGNAQGELVGYCAVRKMLVTKAGKGFAGIVIADPDLEKLTARIARKLRWNGPFEMEFIKPLKGKHMLIEINPRFPAWIDFPSQLGCNLPAKMFDRAFGISGNEHVICPPGKLFIRHSIDLVGDIADLAQMATTGKLSIQHEISELEINQ